MVGGRGASAPCGECAGEPIKALVKAVARGGTGGLDVPQGTQALKQLFQTGGCCERLVFLFPWGIQSVRHVKTDSYPTHCLPTYLMKGLESDDWSTLHSAVGAPVTAPQLVESKLLGHLSSSHRVRKVLLVGEDKDRGVAKLLLRHQPHQFLLGVLDAVPVVAIHHEDDGVGASVVVAPQPTDLVLATDVPHLEAQVLVLHGLAGRVFWEQGNVVKEETGQASIVKKPCFFRAFHGNCHLPVSIFSILEEKQKQHNAG